MMKERQSTTLEIKCDKCGKEQKKKTYASGDNWDSLKMCDCGGEYYMYINGIKKMGQ